MATYPMAPQNQYQHLNHSSIGSRTGDIVGGSDGMLSGIGSIPPGHHGGNNGNGGVHLTNELMQQTYANSYQQDYGTYAPSLQVSHNLHVFSLRIKYKYFHIENRFQESRIGL